MAVPAENGKKVMVAIDESESSYHALMWVLKNLRDSIAASGSPLLIFMAHPFSVTSNVFAASLGSARVYCPVSAKTIAQIGDPKKSICDAAQKHNIDLLVLGDTELGNIQRFFLGSVSNYCVINAKCPVLVVKKPE
ncbi:hypothetical protein RHMOL_Rhmol09G0154900 [Rhododendron molle]|uniref:Uncharacterized protein n=1 Tax=Rhododendron molle TaxID=49168 RepID=A0ACC0MDG7_RHOML|nr:hypothetical protein RHMOL_Rhmol09G0154900 [Rhododendron molle]